MQKEITKRIQKKNIEIIIKRKWNKRINLFLDLDLPNISMMTASTSLQSKKYVWEYKSRNVSIWFHEWVMKSGQVKKMITKMWIKVNETMKWEEIKQRKPDKKERQFKENILELAVTDTFQFCFLDSKLR